MDIVMSALLERMVQFHAMENNYQAIWWLILRWSDPAAAAEVQRRSGEAQLTCARPCDSNGLAASGCCDSIWLPHLELPNMVAFLEEQPVRYRITANATSGNMTWATRMVGTWYAPLDFRAYPFDHQHLLMEVSVADVISERVGLQWDHVAKLNNTPHTKGPDFSGWRMIWGKGKVYDSRVCHNRFDVTAPAYRFPSTGGPAIFDSISAGERYYPITSAGSTEPSSCGPHEHVYDEGDALFAPMIYVADIMIQRVSSTYVLSNVLPVLIISLAVFVVFFLPTQALGERMAVIMTAFLSITAMQFMFDFPPANYINALQQCVLTSYVLMFVVLVESLLVNRITTVAQALKVKRDCQQKYGSIIRRPTFLARKASTDVGLKGSSSKALDAAPSAAQLHANPSRVLTRATAPTPSGTTAAAVATAPKGIRVNRSMNRMPSRGRRVPATSGGGGPGGPAEEGGSSSPRSAARSGTATPGGGGGTAAALELSQMPSAQQQQQQLSQRQPLGEGTEHPTSHYVALGAAAATPNAWQGRRTDPAGMGPPPGSAFAAGPPAAAAQPRPPLPPSARAAPSGAPPTANNTAAGFAAGRGGVEDYTAVDVHPAAHPQHTSRHRLVAVGEATSTDPAGYTGHSYGTLRAPDSSAAASHALTSAQSAAASGPNPFAGADGAALAAAPSIARSSTESWRSVSCWRGLCTCAWWQGCMGGCGAWLLALLRSPKVFYQHAKADPDLALVLSRRIDLWTCGIVLVLYIVCVSVLMWVNVQVGDHRLMLGDTPGNM